MRNGPPGYRRAQQLFLLLGAALGACGGLGREPSRLELDPVLAKSGSGPVVSGRQVVGRLETLGAFGPRTSGSQAAERARRYIRLELERIGLATEEWKLDLPLSEGP